MRRFIAVSVLLVAGAGLPAAASCQGQEKPGAGRPSIVLIMTDDMGYGDLTSFGSKDIRTPNIDRIGREGVRLTDFYSNGALCTPTRAGLISGRYQQRYGFETALGSSGPALKRGLPANGRTLPRLLKDAGYATALTGKWHLGYKPEFSPMAHGYDHFYGLKSGFVDYYRHTNGEGEPDWWEDETPVKREGYTTDLITEDAVSFIAKHASAPFFIHVSYNAPHWPYQPPDRPSTAPGNGRHLTAKDEPTGSRADYRAMVERVDLGVGKILKTLEDSGLAANTIVIFTNDNGGEWLSDNRPLFNRKWSVWEGGIRVPSMVRWPGRIPAGSTSNQVGLTMDLTATILAASRAAIPADARFEGLNLLPIWEGRAPKIERTLFWRSVVGGRNQRAVRSGDWKLVVDANHLFLFNLAEDIGERDDLARHHPDVVRRLHTLLADWERDVDAEGGGPATAGDRPR